MAFSKPVNSVTVRPVFGLILLRGNGSQYTILNLSQQEENCFHQSRDDIVGPNNKMSKMSSHVPGKIPVGFFHFPAIAL